MAKKKKKIDVHSDGPSLPDDRFAALASLFDDDDVPSLPQDDSHQSPSKDDKCSSPVRGSSSAETAKEWSIEKTRKGNVHIRLEKRGGGKTVTVVSGLSGNLKHLLKELKKVCAGGGTLRDTSIEIQGDHQKKIQAYLEKSQ